MTTLSAPPALLRDDLFTHIHKGLRLALFEFTVSVGRTDWSDPGQVAQLGDTWHALLALLQAHTAHEDEYIFRLLDNRDPLAVDPTEDEHRDQDDLLDDLARRVEALLAAPNPADGLALYRDAALFVAAYLPHLHHEETRIMPRIWEVCTDDEIAATRAAFLAATTPGVSTTSLRYMLPALDPPVRRALAAGLAAAPDPIVQTVIDIAEQVLSAPDAAELQAILRPRR
ncbi:MAG: hemerythrin domain-containing protein [Chloroflexi bacterium]|nr:hemerythrin domain-containing protein [Chloroflexota bacterium]